MDNATAQALMLDIMADRLKSLPIKKCSGKNDPAWLAMRMALDALRSQAEREKPPVALTLEQLRERDGKPVWVQEITMDPIDGDYWGIVCLEYTHRLWPYSKGAILSKATNGKYAFGVSPLDEYGMNFVCYDRPPERGTNNA